MEKSVTKPFHADIEPGSPEDYKLIKFSSIPDDLPSWLWYPYIPFGQLTIVQGCPGSGKSSMLLDIIARASTGGKMPDGSRLDKPLTSVYQCLEAGKASITKQMLINAGADLDAVSFIEGSDLTINDTRIQRAVRETDARILVIDPIQNYLKGNMSSAQKLRMELAPICSFAAETDCAVILVGHFTKKSSSEALYRGMGSVDLPAIVRSLIHVCKVNDHSTLRYIRQIKCNDATPGEDFAFEIVGLGKVEWVGPCDLEEFDDLDKQARKAYPWKLQEAMLYMCDMLEDHRVCATDAMAKMLAQGFSMATTRRAKTELGVRSVRQPDMRWMWVLEEERIPHTGRRSSKARFSCRTENEMRL